MVSRYEFIAAVQELGIEALYRAATDVGELRVAVDVALARYRSIAKGCHPDVNRGDTEKTARFMRATVARDVMTRAKADACTLRLLVWRQPASVAAYVMVSIRYY